MAVSLVCRKTLLGVVTTLGFLWSACVAAQTLKVAPEPRPPVLRITQQDIKEPVKLQSVEIKTDIVGRTAETTIDMVFFNPNARVLEGQLEFPLLDGQRISGFALEMENGKLRQAVSVEKDKGRQAFDDVTRQRIDPALLEKTKGNNYQVRVYPLNPKATRRVQLRYTEQLSVQNNQQLYRLPLAYGSNSPSIKLTVNVTDISSAPRLVSTPTATFGFKKVNERYQAVWQQNNYSGTGVLNIALPATDQAQTGVQTLEGQSYFLSYLPASVLPKAIQGKRKLPSRIGLLWDSSLSGSKRNLQRELALLDAYFAKLGNVQISLQKVRDIAEAPKYFTVQNGNWQALRQELESTVYDGATNLGALRIDDNADEYLLFSDGLSTYDDKAFNPQNVTLFSVLSTPNADVTRLRALAEANGGQLIDLNTRQPKQALSALLYSEPRLAKMQSNGVRQLVSASTRLGAEGLTIAGVLTEAQATVQLFVAMPDGTQQVVNVPIAMGKAPSTLAAAEWARLQIEQLSSDIRRNKGEIRRLGKAFSLVTSETSLIVLDRVEDYVRYEITPPDELRKAYDDMRANLRTNENTASRSHLDRIVQQWNAYEAWWNKSFPKDDRSKNDRSKEKLGADSRMPDASRSVNASRIAAEPARLAMEPAASRRQEGARADAPAPALAKDVAAEAPAYRAEEQSANSRIGISLKTWKSDAPYIQRMNEAEATNIYQIYLDERGSYSNSPAFYLDVADLLLSKNQTELGLRVLSNLAELNLENRQLLRILAYRLVQAKQAKLAQNIFAQVLDMAREEPQSFRDLALAQAENKQYQKAIDNLYHVVKTPWHGRFRNVEITALNELNAIVATAPVKLDTSAMDPRLLKNLPLDLRVVLTWDTDNTDVDLWVQDPNEELANFSHKLSYQGGLVSDDYTGGYGPETFSLRQAKKGKYKVQVMFYGERQQILTGGTTIQAQFISNFGKPTQKSELVTMRLKGEGQGIFVGEFEAH